MSDILITIDVEEWFQVENLKECIPLSSWSSLELRVKRNTYRLLDLLDSVKPASSGLPASQPHGLPRPKATFFILGWIAERLPALVRDIHARGHEVASHGYNHSLCSQLSFDMLEKDISDSKKLLEDITGESVFGFRAPNFSIDDDTLKLIQDCGYLYDSSYNSFAMHGRYGKLHLPCSEASGIALPLFKQEPSSSPASPLSNVQTGASRNFFELPVSNFEFKINNAKFIIPWGGGSYFRIIPFPLFSYGVNYILKNNGAYVFYLHPWEIDPDQPRVNEASAFSKFKHYSNLKRTEKTLLKFIQKFGHHKFVSCTQYIKSQVS